MLSPVQTSPLIHALCFPLILHTCVQENYFGWSLPLHSASWMFSLHLPNEMHLTSSLAPDKMNPWGQLSWHTVPERAGSSPHLGGRTVTPAGFWKMGQRISTKGQ